MLMCDIDDFKNLNDRLGHAEGDRCLIKVAGIVQSHMRGELDHVARYGGEEFLVVLPAMGSEKPSRWLNVFERALRLPPFPILHPRRQLRHAQHRCRGSGTWR